MHSFSAEWQPTSMAPSDRDLESACWTMMVSSIRSHLRVTRTGPIGSTLGVRGTSISSRPIGATGVNSTSRRAEQPRPSRAADRYDTDESLLGREAIARLIVAAGAA